MHPLAMPGNKSGASKLNAGDRFIYDPNGWKGTADEFLHDGDAYVTWDDGSFGLVKWNLMTLLPSDSANRSRNLVKAANMAAYSEHNKDLEVEKTYTVDEVRTMVEAMRTAAVNWHLEQVDSWTKSIDEVNSQENKNLCKEMAAYHREYAKAMKKLPVVLELKT